jgi:hypothetical protein
MVPTRSRKSALIHILAVGGCAFFAIIVPFHDAFARLDFFEKEALCRGNILEDFVAASAIRMRV